MNTIAISNLNMTFIRESYIGMVYQARTTKWPSGLTHMVVNTLFNKYVLQDLVSKIELRKALDALIMKKEENPIYSKQ